MQAAAEQACQHLESVATARPEKASAALASASTPVENHVEVVADGGRQAKDYKSKLGVIVSQRTRKATTEDVLRYAVTEPRGPGQGFLCTVVVRLDGGTGSEQSFSGKICSNKKEAMQAAAKQACQHLESVATTSPEKASAALASASTPVENHVEVVKKEAMQAAAEQACQHLESVATARPEKASAALASASTPVENHVEVVADGGRQAKDYKSKLGVIVSQRTRKATTEDVLRYAVTEPRGPGQGFLCTVVVRLDGGTGSEQSFSGKICSNKKEAMQAAAKQACQHLESVATTSPEKASAALASASTPVENHVEVVKKEAMQAAAEQACQHLESVATTRPEKASAALASASVPEALSEARGKFSHCKVAAITLTAACIGALQGTEFQSLQPRNTAQNALGSSRYHWSHNKIKLPIAGTIIGP